MQPSFFPKPGQIPETDRPVTPEWVRPPEDEYPARILVREFLARTAGTTLSVSHIDVYSTGLAIKVDWEVRKTTETDAEWQLVTFGRFHGRILDENALRFGLLLGDDTVVTTVDPRRTHEVFAQRPDGWVLMDQGGGGGGGEDRYSGSSRLWLWPKPPAGQIELVAEWAERGIAESHLKLDGDAIRDAVRGVRPLWA